MIEVGKNNHSIWLKSSSIWLASRAAELEDGGESWRIPQWDIPSSWKPSQVQLPPLSLASLPSHWSLFRPALFPSMPGSECPMPWWDLWNGTLLVTRLPTLWETESYIWHWSPNKSRRGLAIDLLPTPRTLAPCSGVTGDRALPSEGRGQTVECRRRTIVERFSVCGGRRLIRTGDRCLDGDQTGICGVPALPPRRTVPVALHVSVRAARCSVSCNHRSQPGVLGCQRQR